MIYFYSFAVLHHHIHPLNTWPTRRPSNTIRCPPKESKLQMVGIRYACLQLSYSNQMHCTKSCWNRDASRVPALMSLLLFRTVP